jgi:DNA polymerase-1
MAISFKQHNAANQGTVMIVDALNLAFRWKHQGSVDFLEEYLRTVESLAKSYKAEKVIIACDQGSSSFRKAIHEGYKGARKEKFETQTEAERLEFEMFFKEVNRILEHIQESTNYYLFRFNKVEADDIAAYIVKNKDKYGFSTVWLMSSDRDWDLLIKPNVSRFSYVTRKEITSENWSDHYECTQEEYISLKCLQGDAGDSVPGVPGVGPKRGIELIQKYGSALDIAAELPLAGKQKFIQNLNEFGAEGIFRNYQLMDLLTYCDEAIGETNCKVIDEVLSVK